ncbi:hypothetical protein CXB51_012512 [Gossypium anomalum]|uniref:Uncharacterized protein n=1 Tax=Gossypium anomalum TaxID=47600 RepID=A0A8J5YWV1_9ROSI|nr:hypothetical protein CXB51_012512 [Gossypium anomalum]
MKNVGPTICASEKGSISRVSQVGQSAEQITWVNPGSSLQCGFEINKMASSEVFINVRDHGKTVDVKKQRIKCNYSDKEMSGFPVSSTTWEVYVGMSSLAKRFPKMARSCSETWYKGESISTTMLLIFIDNLFHKSGTDVPITMLPRKPGIKVLNLW